MAFCGSALLAGPKVHPMWSQDQNAASLISVNSNDMLEVHGEFTFQETCSWACSTTYCGVMLRMCPCHSACCKVCTWSSTQKGPHEHKLRGTTRRHPQMVHSDVC